MKQTKVKQFRQLIDHLDRHDGRIVLKRGDMQLSLGRRLDVYNLRKGTHRELTYRDALNYYRQDGWEPLISNVETRQTTTRWYGRVTQR